MTRFPWFKRRWKWLAAALILLLLPPLFVELHRRQREQLILDVILEGHVVVAHTQSVPRWALRLLGPVGGKRVFHLTHRAETVVYPPGGTVTAADVAGAADAVNRLGSIRVIRLREQDSIEPGVFAALDTWNGLERLYLTDSGINDESLTEIARLSTLQELDLDRNPVTADGVKKLAALPRLARLSLVSTNLSPPEALAALRPILSLKEVRIGGTTPFTEEDRTRLKQALPNVSLLLYNPGQTPPEWR